MGGLREFKRMGQLHADIINTRTRARGEEVEPMKTKKQKIDFIVKLEKQYNNNYKWIYTASEKEVDALYTYWTQEKEGEK